MTVAWRCSLLFIEIGFTQATMEEIAGIGPLQEFRHAELRSTTCIRLVQIHTELFRGDISCTLQQYESATKTCPKYAAISYVWGDPTPTHIIYINKRVYTVHKSLWEFLSHSRTKKSTEHTWFWTDLLCIDQAHHSEKNEQISRMGDIYAQAKYVISWLGTNGKTAEALRNLVEITEDIDTGCAPKHAWNSSESKRINEACDQLAFRESYWGRVWVLQEVACARNCIVACGDTSVNFKDLQRKMEIAMKSSVRFGAPDRDHRMERIRVLADLKISIRRGKTIKFLELIEKTEFCEATREQDRIYGLLGMAGRLDSEFDSRVLEVSQHKKLADVWWDIIFMISDQESNITIKRQLATLQNVIERLPHPRKYSELEMCSTIRKVCAETASRVSEAAYSRSIQVFLRIDKREETRQLLQRAWNDVTTHVHEHEHEVPGLQTSLGWSAYAGLRFTSWHSIREESPRNSGVSPHIKVDVSSDARMRKLLTDLRNIRIGAVEDQTTTPCSTNSLPVGWLCAAHSTDPPSKTMEKHPIMGTCSIKAPPPADHLYLYCSGAEGDEAQCDLSVVMLKIEQLGVTCLVRSADTVEIDFYCGCCTQGNETRFTISRLRLKVMKIVRNLL